MILVAGEALIDLVVRTDGSLDPVPGGGPYNVARTIGRLGGPVAMAGACSTDGFGERLRAGLAESGVDTDLLTSSDRPSPLAVAELDAQGHATYRFYLDGTSLVDVGAVHVDAAVRAVITGGLALVVVPFAAAVVTALADVPAGVLRVVDVNVRPDAIGTRWPQYRDTLARVLDQADVVKVSTDDLAALAPDRSPDQVVSEMTAGSARVVVVTDGARPVTVATASGRRTVDVPPATVVDTIGAGDTFVGAFVEAWRSWGLDVASLGDADVLAHVTAAAVEVAAVVVGRRGADPPRPHELSASWPGVRGRW